MRAELTWFDNIAHIIEFHRIYSVDLLTHTNTHTHTRFGCLLVVFYSPHSFMHLAENTIHVHLNRRSTVASQQEVVKRALADETKQREERDKAVEQVNTKKVCLRPSMCTELGGCAVRMETYKLTLNML